MPGQAFEVAFGDERRHRLRQRAVLRRVGEVGQRGCQLLGRAESAGKPHAPAARQAERSQHRLEDRLVAESDGQWLTRQRERQQRMRVGQRAGVGVRSVLVAEILDAGLEKLVAALAALAEHLTEIGIAARRAGLADDVVEADGNREFGTQAEGLARLALGEENAAAQILARHVEEGIGRLEHGHVDRVCSTRCEEGEDVRRDGRVAGGHWAQAWRAPPLTLTLSP